MVRIGGFWKSTWLVLFLLISGCGGYDGPRRGEVHGNVTFDGSPLVEGHIRFTPTGDTKGPVAGAPIVDGQYSIEEAKGPVVGHQRVEISAQKKTGRQVPAPPPQPAGTMMEETAEAIPERYNTRTELERELVAGPNVLDFELVSQ